MKVFGWLVVALWAITIILFWWAENYLTGSGEAFGFSLGVATFWMPIVFVCTVLFCLVWLYGKYKRREFKFLWFIPAALVAALVTGVLGYRDGNLITSFGGKEVTVPLASSDPTKSHSYERLYNEPDYWLNIREIYEENGERHRADGPAFNWYYDDGRPSSQEWYIHGVQHREDGPAEIKYYPNGMVDSEGWLSNGRYFRPDGPAKTDYYTNGSIQREEWYPKEPRFEADLPATILYYKSGFVEREIWSGPGQTWHRESGPALIYYYEDGAIKREMWMLNSKSHRENGPANIEYSRAGKVINEEWFVNGEEMPSPKGAIVGPAPNAVTFHSNGNYASQSWMQGGNHRLDGLAKVSYYEDGATKTEEYMKAGKLHREDGPAFIAYDEFGTVIEEKWYLDGEAFDPLVD